ncbi:MAG: hypothetical protein IPL08_21840 [Saprospiraceae bacterium]|nr:hypothetical protein [Saprospiraceae bacterium]
MAAIIFREELESLKNKYMDRFAIHHIFTREKVGIPLLFGRIDKRNAWICASSDRCAYCRCLLVMWSQRDDL